MKRLSCLLAAQLAAACAAVGPDYVPPLPEVPKEWSAESVDTEASAAAPVELERWWSAFGDAELDALIERAQLDNLDLALASARVREARAALGAARSAELPSVDAHAAYSRTRQSLDSRGGAPFFGDRENDLYDVGFDARWELDLFGGVRRSVEAARADVEAVEEQRRAVLVSLVAEVGRNYVELRGLQRLVEVTRNRMEMQREVAEIVGLRADAGVGSDLDSSRAQAQVASTRSETYAFEARIAARIHRLGILLGCEPNALQEELSPAAPLPVAQSALALSQPLELLRRRPDLRRAERECAAASARVGVAVADCYPRVSIGAGFGWLANDFGDLLQSSSARGAIVPSVSLPLFDNGLRRAQVEAATAREEQAVLAFRATVLDAAAEVEDALADLAGATARRASLREAVASQTRASASARDLYASGVADFLAVLDAERELLEFEDRLALSETDVSLGFIALAKALGGGWDPAQPAEVAASR